MHICEVGVCPNRPYWFQRFREFKEPIGRGAVYEDASKAVKFPYKLEPGARVSVMFAKSASNSPAVVRAGLVYAMTGDDRLFTGKSAIVRELAKARQVAHS